MSATLAVAVHALARELAGHTPASVASEACNIIAQLAGELYADAPDDYTAFWVAFARIVAPAGRAMLTVRCECGRVFPVTVKLATVDATTDGALTYDSEGKHECPSCTQDVTLAVVARQA